MASITYSIGWETRPCLVDIYYDGRERHMFWHTWCFEREKNKVYGIVENEFGQILKVEFNRIIFLDSKERFNQIDFELAKAELIERFRREKEEK